MYAIVIMTAIESNGQELYTKYLCFDIFSGLFEVLK